MEKDGITSSSRFMANEIINKWISLFDEVKKIEIMRVSMTF